MVGETVPGFDPRPCNKGRIVTELITPKRTPSRSAFTTSLPNHPLGKVESTTILAHDQTKHRPDQETFLPK